MVPSHFTITNVFPTEPAPPGLNYFFNAENVPTPLELSQALHHAYLYDGRLAGRGTANVFSSDRRWKAPPSAYGRDRLHELGYNYVGIVSALNQPGIWGMNIQGSQHVALDVMSIPELLKILIGVQFSTSTERHWISLGARAIEARSLHYAFECVRAWVYDVQSRREFYDVNVVTQGNSICLQIKTALAFDPMFLTWDIETGLWTADYKAIGLLNATFLVFPMLKDLGADRVFSNFKAE